jgi:hypothetical protein
MSCMDPASACFACISLASRSLKYCCPLPSLQEWLRVTRAAKDSICGCGRVVFDGARVVSSSRGNLVCEILNLSKGKLF